MSSEVCRFAAAFLAAGTLAFAGCREAETPEPAAAPNVLLVCIDALRADHLGAWGASPSPTPALDALARDGVVFEEASSVASWTKPSVPSLLTGLYPGEHGVFDNSRNHADTLTAGAVTLATRLAGHGYRTAAFVENDQLTAEMSGLDRGFSLYFDHAGSPPEIVHRFVTWSRQPSSGPWFAYLHFLDPHFPYSADAYTWPDEDSGRLRVRSLHWDLGGTSWWLLRKRVNEGRSRLDEAAVADLDTLYRLEIAAVDAAVGNLLELLDADGVLDTTLVIVTADHGEGFLERGRIDHGYGPYRELLHVPLLLRLPGREHAGTRSDALVQNVDAAPTILERTGIDVPAEWSSSSLLPLLDGRARELRRVSFAQEEHGHTKMRAAHDRRFSYVRTEDATAPSAESAAVPVSATPGVRIRARGIFDSEHFVASTVKHIAPGDPDTEIEGPVAAIDTAAGTMDLLGVRVHVGDGIPDEHDRPVGLQDLSIGELVRVHGGRVDALFSPTKIERIDVDSVEVEGVIRGIEVLANGDAAIDLGGTDILVDPRAQWKEFPGGAPHAVAAAHSEPGAVVTEELFNRLDDPAERHDVAAQEPAELERMRALADEATRALVVPDAAGARRADLDKDTRERLRALGYVE